MKYDLEMAISFIDSYLKYHSNCGDFEFWLNKKKELEERLANLLSD